MGYGFNPAIKAYLYLFSISSSANDKLNYKIGITNRHPDSRRREVELSLQRIQGDGSVDVVAYVDFPLGRNAAEHEKEWHGKSTRIVNPELVFDGSTETHTEAVKAIFFEKYENDASYKFVAVSAVAAA